MAVGGWVCPNCERRVPAYITVCRCGFSQARSETRPPAAPARPAASKQAQRATPTQSERAAQQGAAIRRAVRSAPGRARATTLRRGSLAWDFWAAVALMSLVLVLAILRLSRPVDPMPALPLLGTVEPERPAPTPPPTPMPRRR